MEPEAMDLGFLEQVKLKENGNQLESAVQVGLELLDNVKATIESAKDISEVAKFLKSIDKVRARACVQEAIVGVVGSTGAGKSSVINALLDQESLVPTSGMRACTAVITEIGYNHSNSEAEKYRAEVIFIKAKDWEKELRILLDDLSNAGNTNIDLGTDSEVGVAYSKLRAVYPTITKDDLLKGKYTASGLAQHESVRHLLGAKECIFASTPEAFSDSLEKYIESRERKRGKKKEEEPMEYWPLIKVVKVFVKSPVLESGLVVVDLPGVQDSNAARSAVASKYIKNCTGLWVIAPITRAVDEKSAHNLMGHSFRRQMQLDGTYSAMTFICSKTDDISVKEMLKAMPDDEDAKKTSLRLQLLEPELVKLDSELFPMEERVNEIVRLHDSHENDIRVLESAINRGDFQGTDRAGVTLSQTGKRKQRTAAMNSRKRTQRVVSNESDDSDSSEDELALSDEEVEECLTLEDVHERLQQLRYERSALFDEKKELAEKLRPLKKTRKEIRAGIRDLKSLLEKECIQFRNDYSTPAIQGQFADGIKELDQEIAIERDSDNFNPDTQTRDYDEVASQLPVFCVSSRGYQKLSGRMDQDKPFRGFRSIDDTQIPALQEHARNMVRAMRVADCRRFLGSLSRCLTSLMVQVVLADEPLKMADGMKEKELEFLGDSVSKLRKDIDLKIDEAFKLWTSMIKLNIFDKFPSGVRHASDAAMHAVASWEKPKTDGGLNWATYRATCVREGVFKGASGFRNLNEELVDPLLKLCARPWQDIFRKFLPKRIDALAADLAGHLDEFQQDVAKRPAITQSLSYGFVSQQTKGFVEVIKDTAALKTELRREQKDANRLFLPAIAGAMSTVYLTCGQETGVGTWKRMREQMRAHVDDVRDAMFKKATEDVEDRLKTMMDDLRRTITNRIELIVTTTNSDHQALIEGKNIFETFVAARNELRDILTGADERFQQLAERPEDEPEAFDSVEIESQHFSPVGSLIKAEPDA